MVNELIAEKEKYLASQSETKTANELNNYSFDYYDKN